MDQENLVSAALEWAASGVPVFPCGPNKAPLTEHGFKDATTDPVKIKFMFTGLPEGCLIGARMGAASGLVACDFDLYKPGAEDYMRYLIDKGLLTETQTHLTMSGGLHMIYKADKFPNCKPAFGVEIKGEGGYVIVPPSPGYSVEKAGITIAPTALIEELLRSQKATSTATVDKLKRDVLSGKEFHDPLAQIAARRSAQGWSIERVQQELLDVLKASAASNPSHPRHDRWQALMEDRGEELSRIVGTGNEKYNSTAKTEKVKEQTAGNFDALNSSAESIFGKQAVPNEPAALPEPDPEDDVVGDWPFAGSGYTGNDKRDVFNQKYIAYPLLAENETVLIAAEPKAGKTAIALTLAAHVAMGKSMGDAIRIVDPSPVLYFTLEGARAVELRLEAMKLDSKEPLNMEKLFVVDRPHSFLDEAQRTANCARIALHSEKCRQEWGMPLGWIVLDTLTKAMPGGDQNSVEDTSKLFELIGMLRTFGVTANIAFIHHLSKQGNVRGSTNIEAEVDVILGVEKVKNSTDVYMNIRRARSIDEDVSYRFAFRSVDLGQTVQGHMLSAPIVELVHSEAVPASGDKVKESFVWKKVCEALIELGKGQHHVGMMVTALAEWVPTGNVRRPNYDGVMFQKPLKALFAGKFSWAFGEWHMTILRDNKENITGIDMRFTG